MYGFEYQKAFSTETLQKQLKGFYNSSEKPKIIEIFTASEENDLVLKEYFKHIQ
jgi:2-succinyl-5-enolpyruvyl-6-hydroxy-3-cyclohexene-1-carboxylate synthase